MIGIRKPGQGYWVRVCSACFWAALVAAGAGYAWSQAGLVPLKIASYDFNSPAIDPGLKAGDMVSLVRPDLNNKDEVFGYAVVREVSRDETGSGSLRIDSFTDVPGAVEGTARDFGSDATRLIEGELGSPTATALLAERSGTPSTAYPQTYLQAGAAGVVLLIGSFVLLWTHGSHRGITDFLIATDGEMRKVNWSTRKEIQGSTLVVIVATFLIAAFLFAFDYIFGALFRFLDVLQA